MTDDELERKVRKSVEEGYTRQEILKVMKEQGYTHHEIGKALAVINNE